MDAVFRSWRDAGLVWLPERGMGYYPVDEAPYDEAYFEKYRGYADTELGRALTAARLDLVDRYLRRHSLLVDVGIGCGAFIDARGGQTFGFDVNPMGVAWLHERDLYLDPYQCPVEAATFWDALEHVAEPARILANTRRWVFASLPIFSGPEHVLRSRHFRRDEHRWYWTRDGLIGWMREHGFSCLEHTTPESLLGREDIHTFVFRRST